MNAIRPRSRHRAREAAFRVIYQTDVTQDAFRTVWAAREADERLTEDQASLVTDILAMLETRGDEVDGYLREAAAHWSLDRLSATDRSALRAAVAEMLAHPGTPARVVMDEAIEIARRFGSDESGRFVNGVLDPVARRLRAEEFR